MLSTAKMLSVNQLAAQVKLTEAWKSINDPSYPVKLINAKQDHSNKSEVVLRPSTERQWNESAKTKAGSESFIYDAAKIWNKAPADIKTCKTLGAAKLKIKNYCMTLPV